MERRALRRVEVGDLDGDLDGERDGDLDGERDERIGATLVALEQQMGKLNEYFGLSQEDLNLGLGPPGPLLADA